MADFSILKLVFSYFSVANKSSLLGLSDNDTFFLNRLYTIAPIKALCPHTYIEQ